MELFSFILDMCHGVRFHLAAVPHGFTVPLGNDLISSLLETAFAVPIKSRLHDINTNGFPQGILSVIELLSCNYHL